MPGSVHEGSSVGLRAGAGDTGQGRTGAAFLTLRVLKKIHEGSFEVNEGSRTCQPSPPFSPASASQAVAWGSQEVPAPGTSKWYSTSCWALPCTPSLLSPCHCPAGTDGQK